MAREVVEHAHVFLRLELGQRRAAFDRRGNGGRQIVHRDARPLSRRQLARVRGHAELAGGGRNLPREIDVARA